MINEVLAMKCKKILTIPMITGVLVFAGGLAISAQDSYTVKVPGGLAFSEFRDTKHGRLFPSVGTKGWSP